MKTNKSRSFSLILALLMVVLMMTGSMTGCNNFKEPPERNKPAAIILGLHKNFSYTTILKDDVFLETLASYIYWDQNVTIISDSGQAAVVKKIKPLDYSGLSPNQRLRKTYEEAKKTIEELEGYTPEYEEVNILNAIDLCSRLGQADVYVYESGLQTTGAFVTDKAFFSAVDHEALINDLDTHYELPKGLTGDIIWFGLGSVCDIQEEFSGKVLHVIQSFWTKVLEACGASSVIFDMSPIMTADNSNIHLPYVTAVPMPSTRIEIQTTLSESELSFVPNKAVFKDKSVAEETLNRVATDLKDYPETTIYVAGSTASYGSPSSCLKLSKDRAEAVSAILGKKVKNKIITIALGREKSKLRENDLDKNGKLNENKATKNRVVYIFTEGTENYKTLKEEGFIH